MPSHPRTGASFGPARDINELREVRPEVGPLQRKRGLAILGISKHSNSRQAVARLDDDEVTLDQIEGSHRPTNQVSESGLYALILRSDKPQARPFRKWVTSEVLPAIRRSVQRPPCLGCVIVQR